MIKLIKSVLIGGFILSSLIACSVNDPLEQATHHDSFESLMAKARVATDKHQYYEATQYLRAIDTRFPFNPRQELVQRLLVYVLYASEQLDLATLEADTYLATYGFSDQADYVYYLNGLMAFDKDQSWLRKRFALDASHHDMKDMRRAQNYFNTIVQRYPKSIYFKDANDRLEYIMNLLAKSEWIAAKYYYDKHAFHACVNRLQGLIEHYPHSVYVAQSKKLIDKIHQHYHI